MPTELRILAVGGMLFALWVGIADSVSKGLATAGCLLGITAFLFLIHVFHKCPRWQRWHFLTALIWTGLTVIETVFLLTHPGTNNLIAYVVLFGAGLALVPTWIQLQQRWQQSFQIALSPSRNRLYTQSLWGPTALGIAVLGIHFSGQRLFENAVAREDLSTAIFLKGCGVATVESRTLQKDFRDAIARKDIGAIATYLSVGTPMFLSHADSDSEEFQDIAYLAVIQDDSAVLETLLNRGVSPNRNIAGMPGNTVLHLAIGRGNAELVRVLLQHGASLKRRDADGYTPFEAAKKRGDPQIIGLITQAMQAKKS